MIINKLGICAVMLALSACTIPRNGPLTPEIRSASAADGLAIMPITPEVVAASQRPSESGFPAALTDAPSLQYGTLAAGDRVAVTIIESNASGETAAISGGILKLDALDISPNGTLYVPYAGSVQAAGRSISQVREAIQSRLTRKLLRPQVELRLVEQPHRNVTIYGAIGKGGAHQVGPGMLRLGDLLGAAAVNVDQPNGATVEVRRGDVRGRAPLSRILSDARQDIALRPGDVVTVSKATSFVTIMGAAGTQGRVEITGQTFSLIDALASARGLSDDSADPSGVFLLRRQASSSAYQPRPLIYQLDVRNPSQVFLAGQFQVQDGDIVLVSTASFAQTRKVLSAVSGGLGLVGRTVGNLP